MDEELLALVELLVLAELLLEKELLDEPLTGEWAPPQAANIKHPNKVPPT